MWAALSFHTFLAYLGVFPPLVDVLNGVKSPSGIHLSLCMPIGQHGISKTGPPVVCLHDCVMNPLKELRECQSQVITKNPQILLKEPWNRSQGLFSRQLTVDFIWVSTFKSPELEPAAVDQTQWSCSQGSFSMRPCVICQSGQAAVQDCTFGLHVCTGSVRSLDFKPSGCSAWSGFLRVNEWASERHFIQPSKKQSSVCFLH